MQLDEAGRALRIGETTLREGDLLTLDGNEGAVYAGAVHTAVEPLVDLQVRLKRMSAAKGLGAKVAKVAKGKTAAKEAAS